MGGGEGDEVMLVVNQFERHVRCDGMALDDRMEIRYGLDWV